MIRDITIGQYYEKTGSRQAANLYYDMVIRQWPGSQAAKKAKQMLSTDSANKGIMK